LRHGLNWRGEDVASYGGVAEEVAAVAQQCLPPGLQPEQVLLKSPLATLA
jgi:hypothetical protein